MDKHKKRHQLHAFINIIFTFILSTCSIIFLPSGLLLIPNGSSGGSVGGGGCKNTNIIIQTTKQLNVNTITLNKDSEVYV